MENDFYESETAVWETVTREQLLHHKRLFHKLFPLGHQESIRSLIQNLRNPSFRGLLMAENWGAYIGDIHPRAFDLLAKYGQDYHPHVWKRPLDSSLDRKCYINSWAMVENDYRHRNRHTSKVVEPIVYVEGVAFGVRVYPMLHGWNARNLASRRAYDTTHHAVCRWTRYLGIPFTRDEYRKIRGFGFSNLLAVDKFPRFETRITRLLAKRFGERNMPLCRVTER